MLPHSSHPLVTKSRHKAEKKDTRPSARRSPSHIARAVIIETLVARIVLALPTAERCRGRTAETCGNNGQP